LILTTGGKQIGLKYEINQLVKTTSCLL
jgi:hypothetical protein